MDITIDLTRFMQIPGKVRSWAGSVVRSFGGGITEADFPYFGMVSKDGRRHMNAVAALNISAVWNAVSLLSGHIAMLPLILYRRTDNEGRERASDHPLYSVLSIEPNHMMTSYQMRQALVIHQELWGDAYIWICRPGNGKVEIWPLNPGVTHRAKKENGQIVYRTMVDDTPFEIPREQIIHIPTMTMNGIDGINPIARRRRSFSLMLAAEEQAESYYENSSKPAGVLQLKKALSDEAFKRLSAEWNQTYGGGPGNHHRTAILEDEGEFKPIQFNAEEIQMLGSREFSVTEVARWFNLPPHKLKDLTRSTFSNIEEQNIDYVQDSLLPRLTCIEQAMCKALLSERERKEYFIEFLVEGLLRGDIKTRYEAYQIARQNGVLSADEWRQKENMNPTGTPAGKMMIVPMNMMPMDQLMLSQESAESGSRSTRPGLIRSGVDKRRTVTNRFTKRYEKLAETILNQEIPAVRKILEEIGDDLEGLTDAFERFYGGFAGDVSRMAAGLIQVNADEIRSLAEKETGSAMSDSDYEAFLSRYIETFGVRYAVRNKLDLRAQESAEQMEERTDAWKESRPGRISRERLAVESAIARTVWRSTGVTKIRSVSRGESCPYCDDLNGKVIGIEQSFLEPGEFQPEGAEEPLRVSRVRFHPPYHDGCDCGIEPVVE